MDDKTCSQPVEAKAEGVVVVTWALDDPKDPFNWPRRKKYLNVLIPIYICLLTAANSTSTGIMSIWGPSRFHTTPLGFQLSVTAYLLPFACGSVLTAPLSELLGRKRIYQVATVLSALLFIPQALTTSLPVLLSMRAVQGAAASAGNALVGGSIADLFRARDRALPTNLFVLANLVGQGIAGLLGWVGGAGIAWCYGVQGIALALGAAGCFALSETRRDVLLSRRAEQLTRSTGVIHVTPDQSDQNESLKHKIRISCTRPIQFMFTEPIVAALSLWIGFNWSCIYLGMSSTLLVFAQYDWAPGPLGSVQLTTVLGGLIGLAASPLQDRLYARACAHSQTRQARPEARLYSAIVGAITFPMGMYAFAWTGRPSVPWPVPALCLVLCYASISAMYAGVLNYLTDAYETYAASAQAAHGFSRSVFAACFPLLTHTMYSNLGYPIASSLVASIALGLGVAPVLIYVYGPQLRARSKITSHLTNGAF